MNVSARTTISSNSNPRQDITSSQLALTHFFTTSEQIKVKVGDRFKRCLKLFIYFLSKVQNNTKGFFCENGTLKPKHKVNLKFEKTNLKANMKRSGCS